MYPRGRKKRKDSIDSSVNSSNCSSNELGMDDNLTKPSTPSNSGNLSTLDKSGNPSTPSSKEKLVMTDKSDKSGIPSNPSSREKVVMTDKKSDKSGNPSTPSGREMSDMREQVLTRKSRIMSNNKEKVLSRFPSLKFTLGVSYKHLINLPVTKTLVGLSSAIVDDFDARDLTKSKHNLNMCISNICNSYQIVFRIATLCEDAFNELLEFLFTGHINDLIRSYNYMNDVLVKFIGLNRSCCNDDSEIAVNNSDKLSDLKFFEDNYEIINLLTSNMCDLRIVFDFINLYFNSKFGVPFVVYRLDGNLVSLFDVMDSNSSYIDLKTFEDIVSKDSKSLKNKLVNLVI